MMVGPVARPRVRAAIERALTSPVTVLAAPPGSGKTVALLETLSAGIEHAYLVLEPKTTLLALVRGLGEAVAPVVGGGTLSFALAHERALQGASPVDSLVDWFTRHVGSVRTTVVVEDVHNAEYDSRALTFLTSLVEATASHVRWVLTTHSSHVLPLGSWLAHGLIDLPVDAETLQFRPDEIQSLLEQGDRRPVTAEQVYEATQGWPAGVAIALTAAHLLGSNGVPDRLGGELNRAGWYHAVARRIVEAHTGPIQAFLLRSSVFETIDPRVLAVSCSDDIDTLNTVARDMPLLLYRRGLTYCYDGHFVRTLRARLAEGGSAMLAAASHAAARGFEVDGRPDDALKCVLRTGDREELERLLATHGALFMEQGKADLVQAALTSLPQREDGENAAILVLRALIEALHGRLDTAEAWFQLAIEIADEAAKPAIVYRYALDLVRRGRPDAVALLEPLTLMDLADVELEVSVGATLATAYALVERYADARAVSERAAERSAAGVSPATRARVLHQASYVAVEIEDYCRSKQLASEALRVALGNHLYDIAARAYSVLYVVAYLGDDDLAEAVRCVERSAELSAKAGDARTRLWSLLAAYYLEGQRGRADALDRIGRTLHAADIAENPAQVDGTLLPAQALRAAWRGEFDHAYLLLAPTAGRQASAAAIAMRWAECALYGAGAGAALLAQSRAAAAASLRALRQMKTVTGRDAIEAHVYLTLALTLLGRAKSARWAHNRTKHAVGQAPSVDALVRAAACTVKYWAGLAGRAEITGALDALRSRQLAGIALLLEALPRPATSAPV